MSSRIDADRLEVERFGDLARHAALTGEEVDAAVTSLNRGERVLVVEEWLLAEKNLGEPLPRTERAFAVSVQRESEKAWCVGLSDPARNDQGEWVPKSQSTLIERADGVESVATPQVQLGDYGGDEA